MVDRDRLVERLNALIDDGRLPDQSRLPPERDLAVALGTTRAHLRQALAVIEAEGRIWRHVGRGTFVGRPPGESDFRPSFSTCATNPTEIMETRLVLEPRLAGLAALRATAADVAEMRRCLDKSGTAADVRTYELWDGTLHRTIAEAAHNNLLLAVFGALNALREDKVWGRLKDVVVTPERKALYSSQHREIIEAIETRAVAEAERRMRRHLETVRDDLFSAVQAVDV